jgi:hypothetical protein
MSALDHKRPSRPGPGSTGRLILPIAIFCAVLAGTRPALADFPSYWVYLFDSFSAWWATILGMLLEGFFVWIFLKVRWYWAFTGVVIANIIF